MDLSALLPDSGRATAESATGLVLDNPALVPELTDELKESILLYFDSGSAGYQARGMEILKRIDTAKNDYRNGRDTNALNR